MLCSLHRHPQKHGNFPYIHPLFLSYTNRWFALVYRPQYLLSKTAEIDITHQANPDLVVGRVVIGPLLDDRLKENMKKKTETMKGCPLFSLSCLSVCLSVRLSPSYRAHLLI